METQANAKTAPPANIVLETFGRVRRITLNRPEKLNAINLALEVDLFQALRDADNSRDINVVVIRGAGRAFSSGHDLTDGGASPDFRDDELLSPQRDLQSVRNGAGRMSEIFDMSIPVIAQIHGYCMGIGTCLALNCDLLVASDDAKIGFPPVRWGGSPPTHMWTYHVGPQWAKYMLLSGDTIDGKTAERVGLVFKSVPPAEIAAVVLDLAKRLALTPRDLLTTNKGICNKALDLMGRTTLQKLAHEADVLGHFAPDAREFLAKARDSGFQSALRWQEEKFGRS